MEISSNMNLSSYVTYSKESNAIKPLYTEKISNDELKEIKDQVMQNVNAFTFSSVNVQVGISEPKDDFLAAYEEFQNFLNDIGYEGQPIAELSKEQAAELVSEDGFFGIDKTSQRIADFVLNGANGNENLLRAGREGMLEGFKQAQQMWGSELPEISQRTIEAATQKVDKAMVDLGFSLVDQSV